MLNTSSKKYILALKIVVPEKENLLYDISDRTAKLTGKPDYKLNKLDSFAHMSVIQFELQAEQNSFLQQKQSNLKQIIECVNHVNFDNLNCNLQNTLFFKTDTAGTFKDMTWCELRCDKTSSESVFEAHNILLDIFTKKLNIKVLNANGDKFSPHFTLWNTNKDTVSNQIDIDIKDLVDQISSVKLKFILGLANDKWELIEVLRDDLCRENPKKLNFSK